MATGKKPGSGLTGGSGRSKTALAGITALALKQLSDPKVRAQIVDQGIAIADLAKSWRTERRSTRGTVIDVTGRPGSAGEAGSSATPGGEDAASLAAARLRETRLQRRITHMRASVAALGARPELAETLAAAATTLDQIESALTVAEGLPLVKRKRAERRIVAELDRLEAAVFDAALPG